MVGEGCNDLENDWKFILTEMTVNLKGATAFWSWCEFFSFQPHKYRVRFLLCRLCWAHTFFQLWVIHASSVRWEGTRERCSGPRSRCCCTAALVSPAHTAQNSSLSVTAGKWLGCSWEQRGMQTLWVSQKMPSLFWVKKKKLKGKSGEGFYSRVLTRLKNVSIWPRASKFGKSGHSEGKAQGMCRKRGQICRGASENPSKSPKHAWQSKSSFGWENKMLCSFWGTGRKASRNYSTVFLSWASSNGLRIRSVARGGAQGITEKGQMKEHRLWAWEGAEKGKNRAL